MDTTTPEANVLLPAMSATTLTTLDILQLYAESLEPQGTQAKERIAPGQGGPVATDAAVTP